MALQRSPGDTLATMWQQWRMAKGGRLDGKRLLIAEDNFLVAEDLRETIRGAGGTVVCTESDAGELGSIVDAALFDCAVLDVQLANGSSVEIARRLKNDDVPFVIVTGYQRSWLPKDLQDEPYLSKPIDRKEFITTVARTLSRKRLARRPIGR